MNDIKGYCETARVMSSHVFSSTGKKVSLRPTELSFEAGLLFIVIIQHERLHPTLVKKLRLLTSSSNLTRYLSYFPSYPYPIGLPHLSGFITGLSHTLSGLAQRVHFFNSVLSCVISALTPFSIISSFTQSIQTSLGRPSSHYLLQYTLPLLLFYRMPTISISLIFLHRILWFYYKYC